MKSLTLYDAPWNRHGKATRCGNHNDDIRQINKSIIDIHLIMYTSCRHIRNRIKKKLEEYIKPKKRKGPVLELPQIRQAIWDDLFEYTRVPYGLLSNAMDHYRNSTTVDSTPTRRLRDEMTEAAAVLVRDDTDKDRVATTQKRKRTNNLQGSDEDDNDNYILYFLMSVVGSQYDDIWEEESAKMRPTQPSKIEGEMSQSSASASKKDNGDEDDQEEEDGTNATDFRCCTVTLDQVLHPALLKDPEARSRVLQLMESHQEAATTVEDQIYILAHKATLMVSA
jgi:hypothetical protein